ncbi:MAG: hypothetical protein IPH44_29820 [Myxococcales bacterium]|nr:hypothetical protein [Myxococcales bacterium]MBK7194936.1 hypothetical protein [Myxococcales bacterium]MBP6846409.1 hypothetical protein [Kofleriaceae bacterium]
MVAMAQLAEMLGARVQGDALVVTRDGVDVVVAATARPGWRFTADAPTLGRLRLEAGLGGATLLAGELPGARPVADGCWRLETSDPYQAARLLAEPPWPVDEGTRRGFCADLIADRAPTIPPPLFALQVARGRATIVQRAAAVEPAHVAGAVRRLVQLVTRPGRLDDAAAQPRRGAAPFR